MSYYIHTASIFAAIIVMVCNPVRAFEASGELGVVIVDPLLIDIKEAQRFCREEPQAVKCDIVRLRLKEKNQKEPKHKKPKLSYNVFNANFE